MQCLNHIPLFFILLSILYHIIDVRIFFHLKSAGDAVTHARVERPVYYGKHFLTNSSIGAIPLCQLIYQFSHFCIGNIS